MTEFDDNCVIDMLIERVKALNECERTQLINSIDEMNTINKKRIYTEEEKSERKKLAIEKRKETIARKKAEGNDLCVTNNAAKKNITQEEKDERKKLANEKRKATWERKKLEKINLRIVDDTTSDDDDCNKSDEINKNKPVKRIIIKKKSVEKDEDKPM
tara:strand:- start:836 stop:1312 length:477 start_codon:yes stop_codon:yes gene_type:complete